MDASSDSTNHGNGNGSSKPDHPATASLPSTAAASSEAPVSSSQGEAPAGTSDEARDPVTGRIKKGKSLNPKGRPPGTPNLNNELINAIKKFRIGKKTYLELFLTRSLQDV